MPSGRHSCWPQAQLTAEVARTTTAIHSFDELLPTITSGISEHLGYYHVGLFLLDEERQYAILRSANTPAGLRMLNRGFRVAVGSISPIGYIAQTGQARITYANVKSDMVPKLIEEHLVKGKPVEEWVVGRIQPN